MNSQSDLSMKLRPIGVVRATGVPESEEKKRGPRTVEVYADYREGLTGIEDGDRVVVMWWMHDLSDDDRRILLCHPMGDVSRPKRGVFALRSPMRPNPIGCTEVDVREVREDGLLVDGLDALDGSPVIDIKCSI